MSLLDIRLRKEWEINWLILIAILVLMAFQLRTLKTTPLLLVCLQQEITFPLQELIIKYCGIVFNIFFCPGL